MASIAEMQLPNPVLPWNRYQEMPQLRQVRPSEPAHATKDIDLGFDVGCACLLHRFDAHKIGYFCDACFAARHPPYQLKHSWIPIHDDVNPEDEWIAHVAR
jgi:hypothetical protein